MIVYRTVLFLFIVILFTSCKNDKPAEMPMEEEKIIDILTDLHFAKVASDMYDLEIRDSMYHAYRSQVFEIHNIDSSEYDKIEAYLDSDLINQLKIEEKVYEFIKKSDENKPM